MQLLLLSAIIAIAGATSETTKQQTKSSPKRTYVCPPDFIRLGNKCYFFSNSSLAWDHAHFACSDMHSTLAIIRSKYQHKLLRNLLTRKYVANLDRWIGGRYDWSKHEWLWGASGKTIEYDGFSTPPPKNSSEKDTFKWHCIILDPDLKYSWNHKSCYEQKHYICQTKLKNLSRKQMMKLRRLYNNRKLNEVPVPEITNNALPSTQLDETNKLKTNEESNDIHNTAFATRPKSQRKRKGGRKGKGRKNRKSKNSKWSQNFNGTLQDAPHVDNVPNNLEQNQRKNRKPTAKGILHWKTYHQGTLSPLHPGSIVEEFDFEKDI